MAEQKEKRVLNIELDDEVKRVSITGMGCNESVVIKAVNR
jgi:tRNA A22 N-methylase